MNYFSDMQERLRRFVLQQIDDRQLSVSMLSQRAGFCHAHLSNFLRKRRGLSTPASDRLLSALGLSAEDLIVDSRAPVDPTNSGKSWQVPIVAHAAAIIRPVIVSGSSSSLHLPFSLLEKDGDHCVPSRRGWTRFVAIQASAADAVAMSPAIQSNAIVILDRHDTSPPRKQEVPPPVFAISRGATHLVLRHVIVFGDQIVLRPASLSSKPDLMPTELGARLIVGRAVNILNRL